MVAQPPAAGRADQGQDLIAAAVRALPGPHRDALIATYYERRSVAQAAAALGITPGAVKARALAALRELRDALTMHGIPIPEASPPCPPSPS
jgi:RNA polymerase sigma-70 factor (ECF subfamily)